MADGTTARALELLSLLQNRRSRTGPELAARLGVSARTLRRDVDRLRSLGYRIEAQQGNVGGYRLAAGADLPPLLLSDDEAVTLSATLQLAAVDRPTVGEPAHAVAVLAKLEQVLPRRLHRRVAALRSATVALDPLEDARSVDPQLLTTLAVACRDAERLRLDYVSADGARTEREVEPTAIVARGRRWYLVCWDGGRHDWRTLRVDRIARITGTAGFFAPRRPPGGVAGLVADRFAQESGCEVTVSMQVPLAEATTYLGRYARDLRSDGRDRTRWVVRAQHPQQVVAALAWIPWPYTLTGADAVVTGVRTAARGILSAVGPDRPVSPSGTSS